MHNISLHVIAMLRTLIQMIGRDGASTSFIEASSSTYVDSFDGFVHHSIMVLSIVLLLTYLI